MIYRYPVGPEVVQITNAGKSGAMWLHEFKSSDKGLKEVYVYHSDLGKPSIETILDNGKRLYTPKGNTDMMLFTPDNDFDAYYAVCRNAGDSVVIIVDEV